MNGMITIAKNSDNIDFIEYCYLLGIRYFRFNMDYENQAYNALLRIHSLNHSDVSIFGDFQGVKMRVQLTTGIDELQISSNDLMEFNLTEGKFPYIKNLDLYLKDLKPGNLLNFADGKIEGFVENVDHDKFSIRFSKVNYVLRNNCGCSFIGDNIDTPQMTKEACAKIGESKAIRDGMVDWVILSFVESASEINAFIHSMHDFGIKVMAKIETPEGVAHLKEIAKVADGLMLGRGDLKNTSGDSYSDIYIQALQSMAQNHIFKGVGTFFLSEYSQTMKCVPAEIAEIEQLRDLGFDYIMLSKEVVNSNYPYETVTLLENICRPKIRNYHPIHD